MERRQIKSIVQSLIKLRTLQCRYCVKSVKNTCNVDKNKDLVRSNKRIHACVKHRLKVLAKELEVLNEIEIK